MEASFYFTGNSAEILCKVKSPHECAARGEEIGCFATESGAERTISRGWNHGKSRVPKRRESG